MRLSRRQCLAWAAAWAGGPTGGARAQPTAAPAGLPEGPRARSADGRWLMAAEAGQARLMLFDADGRQLREWAVATLDGKNRSRVAAIRASTQRQSFVIALQDVAELWEISLDRQAEPIFDGLVHDHRLGEALAKPGYLGVRRSPLEHALADIRLAPGGRLVLGIAPAGGAPGIEVIHLDVRRRIARLPLAGPVDLAQALFEQRCGRTLVSVRELADGRIRVFDLQTWAPVAPAAAEGAASGCQAPV